MKEGRAAGRQGAVRLASLDGLRGLAACGVAFLYHPLLEVPADLIGAAPALLLWLRAWGWTFVDLFFLISGYIFAHVYLSGAGLRREDMADFAVARIARLYPLHLAMLLVSAAMFAGAHDNTPAAFVAHLAMMQGFVGDVSHTFDGPAWSISVEVVCYVVFILAAVRGDRTLRRVSACAIVLALAHFALQGRAGGPWMGDSLPRGLLGFFLGQALWRGRHVLAPVPAWLLCAGIAIGLSIDMGEASSLVPLCLLAWPCTLLLALRLRGLGSRAMLWLGDRSYAVYLVHFPLLLVIVPSLEAARSAWLAGAILLGYTGVVLALSDLAHRRFELPARRAIRSSWSRRRSAAPDLA